MNPTTVLATCDCGRRYHVSSDKAGRQGVCDKCGGLVSIPKADNSAPVVSSTAATLPLARPAAWRPGPELQGQMITLAVVVPLILYFGKDWLSPRGQASPSTSNATAAPGQKLALKSSPGNVSPGATAAGGKLPLTITSAGDQDEHDGGLDALLPPLYSGVSRRELPLDCPLAMGVRVVAFLPDGQHAFTIHHTDRGGALRKWALASGTPVGQPVFLPQSNEYQLAFSPDGNRLAMTLSPGDPGLLLLNAQSGVTLRTRGTNRLVQLTAPAWSSSGSLIFGTPVGTVEQWLIVPDAPGYSLSQGQPVTRVAVTDAGYILSGDQSGEVRLWSTDSGQYAASYRALRAPIRVLESRRFADQVLVLAAGGEPGETWHVHLFDLATQQTLHALALAGPVTSLAVSPDWRQIVTGRRDGMVTVWDTITGDEIETNPVHTSDVTALAVAPDNSCYLSGCYRSPHNRDTTVRLRPLPPPRLPKPVVTPADPETAEEGVEP